MTIYVDKNGVPIFAYFATHQKDVMGRTLKLEEQYRGRTEKDVAAWKVEKVAIVEDRILVSSFLVNLHGHLLILRPAKHLQSVLGCYVTDLTQQGPRCHVLPGMVYMLKQFKFRLSLAELTVKITPIPMSQMSFLAVVATGLTKESSPMSSIALTTLPMYGQCNDK